MHAITAANNLIAAMVDNQHPAGQRPAGIDPRRVTWRRCMDMNDRQLRSVIDGLGGKPNGTPREDGFDITAASEVMATLCLASRHLPISKARHRAASSSRAHTTSKPVTGGRYARGRAR